MDLRIRAFFASILNTIPLGEERDFHFQNYLRIVKFPELFHPTWMVVHNHERYLKIKQDALELGKNVQKLTEKTKYCTNKIPHEIETCTYAHSYEEWKPPYCIWQEFCNNPSCDKNHGLSKEEYMMLESQKTMVNTKFCMLMKEDKPCNYKHCNFCHSFWDYVPLKCKNENCTCKRFHSGESIFSYMEKQDVEFKLFYLRPSEMNNYIQSKKIHLQEKQQIIEWIANYSKELKSLEKSGWVEADFEKLFIEEREEMNEMEVEFTIDGKKTISLSEMV